MGEGRLGRAHDLRRRAEAQLQSAGWLTARDLLEEALAIYRAEGHAGGVTGCLRGLGDAALKLGEPERAEALYAEALATARQAGDRSAEGECLYRQGEMLRAAGRLEPARELLTRAAEVLGAAGNRSTEAQCLGLLGELAAESGAPPAEVLERFRRAQRLQMEAGDLRSAAVTLGFMANYLRERDPAAAAQSFVQAARIYEGLGLTHRAEPFLAAARRLDPANAPEPSARRPGPWDSDD